MPGVENVAPALSTGQDESTFTYAKVNTKELKRLHLQLKENETYTERLVDYYDLDKLVEFLMQKEGENFKYRRIALQFPDDLVCDSAAATQYLQHTMGLTPETSTNGDHALSCGNGNCCSQDTCGKSEENSAQNERQRLWILADTSYSLCCVDEVAAEHVKADLVVHFGNACLNSVSKVDTAFVFGRPRLDYSQVIEQFEKRYPINDFKDSTIVLMADSSHTPHLAEIAARLPQYKTVITDVIPQGDRSTIIGYNPTSPGDKHVELSRAFTVARSEEEGVLQEFELFHITKPEAPRLLQLTTKFQSVTVFNTVDGTISQGPFPNLMKRYRFMQVARTAGTVGILVNTLSLANVKSLIGAIGTKLKEAGKKHYVFVVGKPNVAKLANFESIDLWCVLGCDHQGIILDQTNEYFKPIVTPYELLLALRDELTWTGQWVTDFETVLKDLPSEGEENSEEATSNIESDEEPEFDPVTGKYTSHSRPLRRFAHLSIEADEEPDIGSQAVVKKLSSAVAVRGTVSTSAMALLNREWSGLGSDWAEDVSQEGAVVEDGDLGIARGYDFDVAHR